MPSVSLLFAHAGEAHVETTESTSLLDTLTHQPTWLVLFESLLILLCWFAVLNLFKVNPLHKLLALLPVIIGLALLLFTHNPIATTILLSIGFILAFVLAFLMLAPHGK